MISSLTFEPIGTFHGERKHRYESPRQGVLARESTGIVRLLPQRNFEQALGDLVDFERLWLVYVFHLNTHWKPLVNVPRHRSDKVGVFATRAPHRPNPVGLSCVRLDGIDGLDIHVREVDLLDGSPILDIKPYLPYADSFPDAATGWVRDAVGESFAIVEHPPASQQLDWIREVAGINLRGFLFVQLQHDPANRRRKRITLLSDASASAMYSLAYRTWRIVYTIDVAMRVVTVQELRSGYSPEELVDSAEDRYGDKAVHRNFIETFAG